MVNETVLGPKLNPLKALYGKQFGGGPTPALLSRMDPQKKLTSGNRKARKRKPAKNK